jgi:uncharacterized membrane protein YwzB
MPWTNNEELELLYEMKENKKNKKLDKLQNRQIFIMLLILFAILVGNFFFDW